ncbi:extracellular solute-binding protein [Occultella glacieicola]|uniref:Extracellular solute-binding protein n=1 Tax=Occultella glacieicola TaxID=2518684 RepID=A0ABY2DXE9_9MICO|nr:extracellular solute-binding protein [Occultella glacieicola]TDE88795.1 extracellular solute-binding protein [Occultella glacieicola]
MRTTRRQFLTMASMGAAGLGLASCSRGDTGDGGGGDASGDGTSLTFTWWGNPVRNENTTNAIAAYLDENPDVSIEAQPGEWASYWDRLATQTAGNTAPDVIQMDMAYISEYGGRGALLDLDEYGLDTSDFLEGTADSGVIDGTNYGVNAGINTPLVMVNTALLDQYGISLPDDTTWTWDDWLAMATSITDASAGAVIGTSAIISNDAMFSAWLRQQGKELFLEGAQLGFEVDDVTAWLEFQQKFADAGAMPSASQITEESSVAFDQSMFLTGKTGMAMYWSNQLEAAETASGAELTILRFPSLDGDATTRKAWYKASMLWSASARTENPEAAVAFINWLINSTASGEANLAERGIPANQEVQAHISDLLSDPQQRVAAFISEIEPELGDTPIAPPPGGGQFGALLLRYATEMLFGNSTAAEAASGFYDELTAAVSGS